MSINPNILGQGAYGVVYDTYDKNKVIKVYFETRHDQKVNKEVSAKISRALKRADKNQDYFITSEFDKYIRISKLKEYNPAIASDAENIYNISSEKTKLRAQLFEKVYKSNLDFSKWSAKQIRHLLKAVAMLHQEGICHNDLHFGNIMFKNNLPVLIDLDTVDTCTAKQMSIDYESIEAHALGDGYINHIKLSSDKHENDLFQQFLEQNLFRSPKKRSSQSRSTTSISLKKSGSTRRSPTKRPPSIKKLRKRRRSRST